MSDREALSTRKIIRRKVQVVGGNTITVSLPRKWADKHRLGRDSNQQSEVSMRYMPDGTLLMSPASTNIQHQERARMHKLGAPDMDTIKRTIVADFLGGIDVIQIRFRNQIDHNVVLQVRDFVDKRLIGFDTIESEYGVDVVNMTQAPKFQVDKLLEIIRVQSTRMMDMCHQWIKDDSIDLEKLASEMHQLELTLDRRANQMIRTLQLSVLDYWMAESVNLPMPEIIYWSTVTKATENAADLTVAIAKTAPTTNMINLPPNIRNELFELGEVVTQLFSRALSSFIQNDSGEALQVLEEQAKTSATTQIKWPIASADQLGASTTLIMRHLEKISAYARKIAEATIDCEAARVAYLSSEIDD